MSRRFRGFLPVVVDVETGGFDARKDALLEIAAITLKMDDEGYISIDETVAFHIEPFEGANLDPKSMAVNGIKPYHPFRFARPEQEALNEVFYTVRQAVKKNACTRAIMVGHNTNMDLTFVNTAADRCDIRRNPFHPFSTFDTVSFAGLAYGQTVLSRAAQAAGLEWDPQEAHSALYDCRKTADLFCKIVNRWRKAAGPIPVANIKQHDDGN